MKLEHLGELVAGGGGAFPQEEVVDHHQVGGIDLSAVFAQLAELACFVDLLDQYVRLAVEDLVAALHSQLRDRLGAVAFAGAGLTDQEGPSLASITFRVASARTEVAPR